MHGRTRQELPAFSQRLRRQADATKPFRKRIYEEVGLRGTILDVGCGNGCISQELRSYGHVYAVDLDGTLLQEVDAGCHPLQADGTRLPFPDDSFDFVVLNLVLLWVPDPPALLAELRRVVKPGGRVLASMEPDYGGKVHWPTNPLVDSIFQGDGVRRRGGDPLAGRKLRQWFTDAGLITTVGLVNGQVPSPEEDLLNFRRNRGYYHALLREGGFDQATIDAWEAEFLDALDEGIAFCFLPLFWATGTKPGRGFHA